MCWLLGNISKVYNVSLAEGMDPATFRDIIYRMVHARTNIKNVDEVAGAIEYQYTFWAKPDNKTAVRQNLIDVRLYALFKPQYNTVV